MQLYNTLTRKKEPFTPITPGKVGLYACGIKWGSNFPTNKKKFPGHHSHQLPDHL